MTDPSPDETAAARRVAAEHWEHLFSVRRSVRYHRRRERFLDRAHKLGALVAAISGSAAVASLLAELGTPVVTAMVAATAVTGALELVFGFARGARLHSDLARDFIGLEQELVRASERLSEERLQALVARRLDIESREPPVLRVLDAMCHDELVTALGIDDTERSDPGWLQRCLANVSNVGAPQLRKHSARERGAA